MNSKRVIAAIASAAVVGSGLIAPALTASATAAPAPIAPSTAVSPRVAPTPLPPTLLWQENFENGTGSDPVTLVGGYTGLGGTTYTASAAWADPDLCNGIVLNGQSSGAYQLCAANPAMDNLRLLAGYIGQHNGDYPANNAVQNHVVAAYTNETPGRQPPQVLAQTSQAVTLNPSAEQNRFITASVWVAATNCRLDEKDPMLRFQWSSNGSAWNNFGASIDVCRLPSIAPYPDGTDGPTVVTQAFANGGNLQGITTTSLFVRVINTNEIDAGTDMAWDNLAIYEGTPQLTKEFVDPYIDFGPGPDGNGYFDWSTLTFRITNSADLSAKTGIGFTDNLPAGMTIDDPVYTAVNCPTGTVSAVAGGTSIAVSGVSLPYGGEDPTLSSCTIEVDVIGTPSAIYTNDDTNNIRSPLGILPNTSATLTVVDGAPTGAAATDDALSGPYNQPLSFTPLTNDSAGTPASPYTASSFDMGGMRLCDVDPDETPPNCTQTLVFTDDGDYELNPGTGAVVFTPAPGFTGVARPIRYQVPVDYSFSYGPNPNDVADHAEVFDALIEPTIGPPTPPPPPPGPSEAPALNLVKTATPITFSAAGDRITYTTVTTNTGDVPLTNVTVRDPLTPGATCTPSVPVASLAVGASIRCTGTYTVSEADAAAGVVNNTARAVGTSPAGRSITASGTAKVPGPKPAPVLSLTKIPTPSKFAATGDTITYRIVATNSGVVPVTNAVVSDPQLTGLTCSPALPVATLPVGASITCSGTHAVTSAERAANVVKNTARVTGIGPDGTLATATGTVHVPGPDASTPLSLVKLADKGAFTGAGDRIGYTLRATNTGTAAITNATITDPKLGSLSCTPATPIAALAAGASITCTGSHTATANDASAGVINNTATATGVGPQGQSLSVADSATVPAAGNRPAITLVKSPQPAVFTTVGQAVTYSLQATNTGSVTLTGARVEDPMLSGLSCTPATPVASLPVGGTIRCTGTYTVTAADLRQGVIDNTAITTGVSPSGAVVTGNATTRVIGPDPVPSLLLLKSTDSKVFRAAGQSIAYRLTTINTGTTTLSNVTVTDPQISNLSCVPSVPVASLAPGASITCTGSHVVTAAEASAGQVDNVARAVGTGPNGQRANATGTRSIPEEKPALTVVKTPSPAIFNAAKEKITYTIVTTNSGDVPLSDVRINDPLLSSVSCSPAQPASLAVGASMRCTGTHAVTSAEARTGVINNTVAATGVSPAGVPVSAKGTAKVHSPKPAPVLQLIKTPTPDTFARAGDVVTYRITATNAGAVDVTNAVVADPQLNGLTCTPAIPVATFPVGASITCTGTHTVTAAEAAAGVVINTAEITGRGPDGTPASATGTAKVTGTPPAITVTKAASPATFAASGDTLRYTVKATNTSGSVITGARVSDPMLTDLSCTPAIPVASFQPGASITCTGTHRVTSAQDAARVVDNTATASGTGLGGIPVGGAASARVPKRLATPALALIKSADPARFGGQGANLAYTLTAINTGNAALTDVIVEDPLLSDLTCSPATPVRSLAPGATITCTGTHKVTSSEATAGVVDNSATAVGTSPQGAPVTATATTQVPGPSPTPALRVVKSADPTSFSAAGEVVDYTIVATNTGSASLTNATVTDTLLDGLRCTPAIPVASLAPGASITCTGSHTVTNAEAAAQRVENVATATGVGPDGRPANGSATVIVPGRSGADLAIVKSHEGGDVEWDVPVTYQLTVTNNGPSAASQVRVVDTMPAGVTVSSATGSDWRCSVKGAKVTCTRGTMANGTTSVITVNTVPTVDAIGTVKNTATVKSATTDPNPANNTSTDVLQVRKKPQPPIVPPKPQISKGSMLISVGKTVAGQQIRLKVVCIPLVTDRTTPRGDVLPCQITKLGRGQVRVTTEIPVTVVATYSARELQGWFAYRETKRYLLRP